MKIADVRQWDNKKINQEMINLKKQQLNLRFQNAAGQLENTAQIKKIRRDIAQLKTIRTEKNIENKKVKHA